MAFEEDVGTKTDSVKLGLLEKLSLVHLKFPQDSYPIHRDSSIRLVHTPLGVSRTFEMHPCPYRMGLISKKYSNGVDGMERDPCLVPTLHCKVLENLLFQFTFTPVLH